MRGPLPGLTSKSAGGHAGRGLSADYTLPNGGTWAFYLVLFLHLVSCCLFCTRSTTYRLRRCRASSLNGKRRCSLSTSVTLSPLCCTWRERRRSCSRFVYLFSDQLRYCLCCWSDHFQRHDHSSWCWWQCIRSSYHLLPYHLYPLSPSLCECILVWKIYMECTTSSCSITEQGSSYIVDGGVLPCIRPTFYFLLYLTLAVVPTSLN